MDNVTHGLAGALLAQAGFRQRYGPAATVALIVGAELPDMDALFDLAGPIAGFQNHRGITHSFVGGVGIALGGAAILYTLLRHRAYWRLVGLVYLGVLLHIWMDYLTSYGTQLFLPFDAGRYTADAVFIVDYFYTGIIILALLAVRMVRRQRQARYCLGSMLSIPLGVLLWYSAPGLAQKPLMILAISSFGTHLVLFAFALALLSQVGRSWLPTSDRKLGQGGVAALAAYMALCMVSHSLVTRHLAATLQAQNTPVQRVSALPLPGGVLYWRGIAETPATYLVSQMTLWSPAISPTEVIPKGLEHQAVQATSQYRLVRIFEDFARFPVVEYRQQGAEQVVRYMDLRFTGYGRDRSWFDLEVHMDPAGRVQLIKFLNHIFFPHHPDF